MNKPTIASQFPEMISLKELKMSLFLLGWKYEDSDNTPNKMENVLTWHSSKNDIIQIKQYPHENEISYFKNWPAIDLIVSDIEGNGTERLHMYTYKEALIMAELRT